MEATLPETAPAPVRSTRAGAAPPDRSRLNVMNFLNEVAGRYPEAISFASGRPAEAFFDVQDYAREKQLPIGINVESVSIRKSEIDASVELYRRLSSRLE